ncbi:hypothetical protein [Hippea jasoniae]|uniref:hypothetical protein n=1 Tax=Hippea jasoniae TaxID=944479 RepID=UPI00054FE528|nr:hypothetical protein [Hippea jasoniae]
MLKWKIDKNVISELYYNEQNIIYPWGFETADSSAFYSLEDGYGYRYKIISENIKFSDKYYKAKIVTKMKEGQWELNIDDKIIDDKTIERKVEAITLEDSFFMDFVVRFRFKKEFIEYVKIADKVIYHKNTNIYYQYPVEEVFLKGKELNIKISIVDKIIPNGMKPVMYVRDNNDEWIVHVRMIPETWDKEVIKLCTSWAKTRPLPQFLSNIFLEWKWLREQLWYRGERDPYKNRIIRKFLNPCAFAIVKLAKNEKLMWNVKCEIL